MTWTRTALYWIVASVLIVGWVALEPEAERVKKDEATMTTLLPDYADEVTRLVLRWDDKEVRCERGDGRWKIVHPEGRPIPSDLVAALVSNLTEGQEATVVREQPTAEDLESFGLQPPESILEVTVEGRDEPTRIEVGASNPVRTAVYARTDRSPAVFLVGLNVRYYSELLFEAAYPQDDT